MVQEPQYVERTFKGNHGTEEGDSCKVKPRPSGQGTAEKRTGEGHKQLLTHVPFGEALALLGPQGSQSSDKVSVI